MAVKTSSQKKVNPLHSVRGLRHMTSPKIRAEHPHSKPVIKSIFIYCPPVSYYTEKDAFRHLSYDIYHKPGVLKC